MPRLSNTLVLLGPSHKWYHHVLNVTLGSPSAHGVTNTSYKEVRDNYKWFFF